MTSGSSLPLVEGQAWSWAWRSSALVPLRTSFPPVEVSTVTAIDLLDGTVLNRLLTFAQALCFSCHGGETFLAAHAAGNCTNVVEVFLRGFFVWAAGPVSVSTLPLISPMHTCAKGIVNTLDCT